MIELGRLVCSVRDCEAHPILACSVKFFCQEHADIHLRDETKKLYRSKKKRRTLLILLDYVLVLATIQSTSQRA